MLREEGERDTFKTWCREYERVRYHQARYHEAGHAVVAELLGRRVKRVLAGTEEVLAMELWGKVQYVRSPAGRRARRSTVRKAIQIAYAGGIAERMADPAESGHDEHDLANVAHWSRFLPGEDLSELRERAASLLRDNWGAVEAVACGLEACDGELDGRSVRGIIREALAEKAEVAA